MFVVELVKIFSSFACYFVYLHVFSIFAACSALRATVGNKNITKIDGRF